MFCLWLIVIILSVGFCWNYPTENKTWIQNTRQPRHLQTRNTCNCVCGVSNRQMRVVGGQEATKHEFPWIAGINVDGKFYCGGSLISRKHILTAAHCVQRFDYRKMKIILGDHNRNLPSREDLVKRRVIGANIHSGFDPKTYNNDIAVLELDQPVEFNSKILPACLPSNAETDYTGRIGIIAGWGKIEEYKEESVVLRKLSVPVWSREACLDAGYQTKRITHNMFCAGYKEGKQDACQGDSGGPLHMSSGSGSMEIIGLVSWGRGCARPNFPGLYTKVVNYLDWIQDTLNGECVCPPAKY